MIVSYTTTSGPDFEPVTLDEMKLALKVDTADDDDLISEMISSAREWIEDHTGQRIMKQTVVVVMDVIPAFLKLYVGPILSIDSITYLNDAGDETVLDSSLFSADLKSTPKRILFTDIPSIKSEVLGGVEITLTCGFSDSATESVQQMAVPAKIKRAIKYLVTTFYQRREDWFDENPISVPQRAWSIVSSMQIFKG